MNQSPLADIVPLLLTMREARRLLSIGDWKLRQYVKAGELELVKIGSASRIPRESLEALLARLRGQGA